MIPRNDAEFDDVRNRVMRLSPVERARIVHEKMQSDPTDVAAIRSTDGVCGGDACIRNTRIMVWLLESLRRLGVSEADLLTYYPSLTAEDLVNAWQYVEAHPAEIDDAIRENADA